MYFPYINAFLPVMGLGVNVALHVASARFTGLGMLKSVVLGFSLGFLFLFAIECALSIKTMVTWWEFWGKLLTNSVIYSALGYGYFHFINLGETGRRIRIMREIYEAGGGLTMEELLERYNADTIVGVRFARLLSNNQVVRRNGKYFIGRPTVLLMAKFIAIMKYLLLGKKSEFD